MANAIDTLYPWLQTYSQRIRQAYQADGLHHGYLFTGQQGTGRYALCLHTAALLLCAQQTEQPCKRCDSCQLFYAGNHPDFVVIGESEEEKAIAIENIRAIGESLSVMSHQGGNRVLLIREAHRLTKAATNALLKSLEEPSPNNYFLLTSSRPYRLPATVRSRLQNCHITQPPTEIAVSWLTEQGISAQSAREKLALAHGAPLKVSADTNAQDMRQLLRSYVESSQTDSAFTQILTQLESHRPRDIFFTLESWVSDMIRLAFGGRVSPYNSDVAQWLQEKSAEQHTRALWTLRDTLIQCVVMEEAQINLNTQLVYLDCWHVMRTVWRRKV